MENSFNFGFSKTLFITFQTIYFKKEISLKNLSEETNSPKTSISEQIRILKKRNLILDRFQKRQKIFSINIDELKKWTKIENTDELNSIILSTKRFSQFINYCRAQIKNRDLKQNLTKTNPYSTTDTQLKILSEENKILKQENALLKKKIEEIQNLIK
jgi:DNA-binding transcriptional regulator GbsR (MarR family)